MTFKEAITTCFQKKYATFTGRASRQEFWYFYAFTILVSWTMTIVGTVVGGEQGGTVLNGIVSLALLLPQLAVSVRRLHDTNRSGWWYLLGFTCVGIFVLIYFWAQESNKGDNLYGPEPNDNAGTDNNDLGGDLVV